MIRRIHLRCGSFGSTIRFSILVKKRYIRFRIKNPDLDFGKETQPEFQLEWKNEDKELTQLLWNKFKVSDISSLNFIRLLRVLFSSQQRVTEGVITTWSNQIKFRLGLQYTFFFFWTCHELFQWFELSRVKFYKKDLKNNHHFELAGGSSYRG